MPESSTAHLQQQGFAWCRGFADEVTCNSLRVAIASVSADLCHGLRNLDKRVQAVAELAASQQLSRLVARCLGGSAQPPQLVRAIFFDKTPETNWGVPWHQDVTIAVHARADIPGWGPWSIKAGVHHVQPTMALLQQMITLRLHLDETTLDNGCLRLLPRSHQQGLLSKKQVHDLKMTIEAVDCCAAAGDVLLMRPLLLHSSLKGQSLKAPNLVSHRRIIHLEFCAATLPSGLRWA